MSVCVSIMPDQPVVVEVVRSSLDERVRHGLMSSPYLAVRRVNVEVRQDVLTLSGRLPNYYLKQVAQTAAAKVAGVTTIINRIDVVEPGHWIR